MAIYDVSYEMSFWMKVKAKSEAEAENIAERNPCAPFDREAKGRKQGILYSAAGEPHDFIAVRARRKPAARRGKVQQRSPQARAPAKARGRRKARTADKWNVWTSERGQGGDKHEG